MQFSFTNYLISFHPLSPVKNKTKNVVLSWTNILTIFKTWLIFLCIIKKVNKNASKFDVSSDLQFHAFQARECLGFLAQIKYVVKKMFF